MNSIRFSVLYLWSFQSWKGDK